MCDQIFNELKNEQDVSMEEMHGKFTADWRDFAHKEIPMSLEKYHQS